MRYGVMFFVFCLLASPALAVIYVDVNSPVNGTGLSWGNPRVVLQEAIDHAYAIGGDEVWVRKGVYAEVIEMRPGVAVYGGFTGTEHTLIQRKPWVYITTIDATAIPAPNHVVIGTDDAVLDGFTITGGSATSGAVTRGGGLFLDGTSPLIANCVIRNNEASTSGGGAYVVNGAEPVFRNCAFYDNLGGNEGGGMLIGNCQTGAVEVVNCVFSGNSAFYGGAVSCSKSNPTLSNCTFNGNTATWGGAFFTWSVYYSGQPRLYNCILWDNTQQEMSAIIYSGAPPLLEYCNVKGGWNGTGNINANPLFVNAAARNYRLQFGSPCIDAASATYAPDDDIRGVARPVGAGYDIGAYEYNGLNISINIAVKPPIGRAPLRVKFENKTSGCPDGARWIWDFGDGARGEGFSPEHIYTRPGLYSVTATMNMGEETLKHTRRNAVLVLDKNGMCPLSWLIQWLLSQIEIART